MKNLIKDLTQFLGVMRLYARVGLSRMTPRKAYVMARYWFLTNILQRKIPWLMELSVTYRCQCRCKHCSVSNYFEAAKKEEELTTAKIKDILRQTVKMGIPKVDYFGGEPLLREDIVELVQYGESLGLYISITTNAWGLNEDMLINLKKAGISCLNVSLDSVDEAEHDDLRGIPGIYQRSIDSIKACHQYKVPCIVSTYVTRKRLEGFATDNDHSGLTAIINLSKQLKATGIRILFPIISGEWVTKKKVELTDDEKRFVIDHIDPSFAFIEGAYSVVGKKKVCQALSGKMVNISPYGEIQLCVAFPRAFGNVKDASLQELVHQMWQHPIYQKNEFSSCCSTNDLKE